MQYTPDNPLLQESYEADAPTTTRLRIGTMDAPPILAGILIGLSIFLLGWHTRELFALAYDYHLLVLVIPLTAGMVAWGNAR